MKIIDVSKQLVSKLSLFSKVLMALLMLQSLAVSAAKVTGVVMDANSGQGIPGVTILVESTQKGVVSNEDGGFSIEVPDLNAQLIFSFIGYETQTLKLKGQDFIQVFLEPSDATLEEVIVVGYGVQRKMMVTGAVSRRPSKHSFVVMDQERDVDYFQGNESYSLVEESGFSTALSKPLSTFSISVDKASYANVRRFINHGQQPPADAVRIEEMINYFKYAYEQPVGDHPFSVTSEYVECPWQKEHRLLHIGLQGKDIPVDELPPSNLVFLIDVSGSMDAYNKLPLVKAGFKMLVNKLREKDHVAIVYYANEVGILLPSTPGHKKEKILKAIDGLSASGGTRGGDGLQKAYEVAVSHFIPEGNNRVILATDGDFNIGISNENDLKRFIQEQRKTGVFLTCLGFGMGNYKGNYAYIDNLQEAQKTFLNEFGGTLFTIAKDVKLQVDFNPAVVEAYRLIGYEKRRLKDEDFKDDAKDAGEIGSGHTVTALYEIIPTGVKSRFVTSPDLSDYQTLQPESGQRHDEVATIRVRYKQPQGDESAEFRQVVKDGQKAFSRTSDNFRFSSAVALFGMLLQNSEFKGTSDYDMVVAMAQKARGLDEDGYRAEFVRLVKSMGQITQ
ncbi:MAG: von Willebrand factor type A domain-containing protein [Bacteroidales bacterium]|nr:von Willebrand factor type A domain-containing protein [Bacteroidales bacterium]